MLGFVSLFSIGRGYPGHLVLFREYVTTPGRLLRRLAADTYGVYTVHLFIVVALQLAVLAFVAPALVKFAVVTILAVA